MKRLVNIFMVVALVVTMAMPAMSKAMTNDITKSEQAHDVAKGHDCHKNKANTEQSNKDTSNKCCDDDICKCKAGFCSGGLAKIFGNNGFYLAYLASENTKFSFADQSIVSGTTELIQRPPKA